MELILNTFGVSLNRDNEAFVITKKGERRRIPVDDVKSIQISRGAVAPTLRGWEGEIQYSEIPGADGLLSHTEVHFPC